jgi:hypothetical protein
VSSVLGVTLDADTLRAVAAVGAAVVSATGAIYVAFRSRRSTRRDGKTKAIRDELAVTLQAVKAFGSSAHLMGYKTKLVRDQFLCDHSSDWDFTYQAVGGSLESYIIATDQFVLSWTHMAGKLAADKNLEIESHILKFGYGVERLRLAWLLACRLRQIEIMEKMDGPFNDLVALADKLCELASDAEVSLQQRLVKAKGLTA